MLYKGTADLVDSNQYLYVTNLSGSINTYTKGVNVSFTGLANTAAVCLINVTDASTFQVGGYGAGGFGFGITNDGEYVQGIHSQVVDATNYKYAGIIIVGTSSAGNMGFTIT